MAINPHFLAIIFQEGGRLISEIIRTKPSRTVIIEEELVPQLPPDESEEAAGEEEKAEVATACIPCAIGHYGTCTGLLNEAMRFAKKDGVGDREVITRVQMCLAELNAMERVDLRPEMTVDLPTFEKQLADKALVSSRQTRHTLEGLATADDLERAAANLQRTSNDIGTEWYQHRIPAKAKEIGER